MAIIYAPQPTQERSVTQDMLGIAKAGNDLYNTGLREQQQMWNMRTGDPAIDNAVLARMGVDFQDRGVSRNPMVGVPSGGGDASGTGSPTAPGLGLIKGLDPKNVDHLDQFAMMNNMVKPKTLLGRRMLEPSSKGDTTFIQRQMMKPAELDYLESGMGKQQTGGVKPSKWQEELSSKGGNDSAASLRENMTATIIEKSKGNTRKAQYDLDKAIKSGSITTNEAEEAQKYIDQMKSGEVKYSDFEFDDEVVDPNKTRSTLGYDKKEAMKQLKESQRALTQVEQADQKKQAIMQTMRAKEVLRNPAMNLTAPDAQGQFVEMQNIAMTAIQNAKSYPEKMKLYNQYAQGNANLQNHWRWQQPVMSPQQMGILPPARGGGRGSQKAIFEQELPNGDKVQYSAPKNATVQEREAAFKSQVSSRPKYSGVEFNLGTDVATNPEGSNRLTDAQRAKQEQEYKDELLLSLKQAEADGGDVSDALDRISSDNPFTLSPSGAIERKGKGPGLILRSARSANIISKSIKAAKDKEEKGTGKRKSLADLESGR